MAHRSQIQIPEPCQENWDQMKPAGNGMRHCDVCQRDLVDFRNLTDGQLRDYITNQPDKVCGVFHPDQVSRDLIDYNHPKGLSKLWAAASAVLAGLSAYAQTEPVKPFNPTEVVHKSSVEDTMRNRAKRPAQRVNITVVDEQTGETIPQAIIALNNSIRQITDFNGVAHFMLPSQSGPLSFTVNAFAYEEMHYTHFPVEGDILIELTPADSALMGVVVIVEEPKTIWERVVDIVHRR